MLEELNREQEVRKMLISFASTDCSHTKGELVNPSPLGTQTIRQLLTFPPRKRQGLLEPGQQRGSLCSCRPGERCSVSRSSSDIVQHQRELNAQDDSKCAGGGRDCLALSHEKRKQVKCRDFTQRTAG